MPAPPPAGDHGQLDGSGLEELETLLRTVPGAPLPGESDERQDPVRLVQELTREGGRLVFASGGAGAQV